jgi:CDGSH-type Zn-finger protein
VSNPEPPAVQVRVTPDGPYVVTGGLPVGRRRPGTSEHGEPLAWESGEQLPVSGTYALCRCGQSGNKPFCDGTHARVGFDGTETADTSGYDSRATTYPGTGVTVRDDRSICQHAGFCGNRVTNVWKMVPATADTQVRAQVMAMIERCPSGALTYAVEGHEIEPDLRPAVGVVDDGPLAVTGGVGLVRTDGTVETRARVTLCRCGQSGNKPFCDGIHVGAGFRDDGTGTGDDVGHDTAAV